MKIKTKMSLISSAFLILMTLTIIVFISYMLYKRADDDIAKYRGNEMKKIQSELKNKVDMAAYLLQSEYENGLSAETIKSRYGSRVKNVIETAHSILVQYEKQVVDGSLTIKEAQEEAKKAIKAIRYDNGVGYVWINDSSEPFAKMIMHPTVPALDGTVLDDEKYNNAEGPKKNLFSAAVNVAKNKGSGFVSYQWPKPKKEGGMTEMQPKISYVSLFEPWGWVLGSGIYVDDARTYTLNRLKEILVGLRYDNNEGYFFLLSNELPFPKLVYNPTMMAEEGMLLDNAKFDGVAMNKTKHLFTAMIEQARNHNLSGGFVDYKWQKQNGSAPEAKLSNVKIIPGLDWIVGTGVHTDGVEKIIKEKEQEAQNTVVSFIIYIGSIALGVLILCLIASHIFARRISKSIEEITAVAREISLGKGLETEITSTHRKDEIGQLARATERLQTSIKMMMSRMKK